MEWWWFCMVKWFIGNGSSTRSTYHRCTNFPTYWPPAALLERAEQHHRAWGRCPRWQRWHGPGEKDLRFLSFFFFLLFASVQSVQILRAEMMAVWKRGTRGDELGAGWWLGQTRFFQFQMLQTSFSRWIGIIDDYYNWNLRKIGGDYKKGHSYQELRWDCFHDVDHQPFVTLSKMSQLYYMQ